MDFKQLISKIDSIEAPQATPAAPKLPEPVQLNEDAQLRVLAGTSSILAEAKKMKKDEKKDEKMDEASDRPDAKKTATTWKDKSGNEHPATKVQGHASRKADKDAEKETKGSPFSSTTLLAFAGSFSQSPNQSLNAFVRTNLYCSGVRLLGFPLGAKSFIFFYIPTLKILFYIDFLE